MTAAKLPSLVIVGRPNVGKSALFNRLTGTRRSIVTDEPGITRDRIYGAATWRNRSFEVVDTGGLVPDDKAEIPREILRQAKVAIDAATRLVLVVDARAGLTPLDAELARLLRRTGKPLLIAANKADTARRNRSPLRSTRSRMTSFPSPPSTALGLTISSTLARSRDFRRNRRRCSLGRRRRREFRSKRSKSPSSAGPTSENPHCSIASLAPNARLFPPFPAPRATLWIPRSSATAAPIASWTPPEFAARARRISSRKNFP